MTVDTIRETRRAPAQHRPGAATAIRTRGLTKVYGDRTAVDGLDLELPDGVVSGFVGPNGSGKTTTIRMLLGLVRPTAGDGEILGSSLEHPAAYLPGVGALIEGPAFSPALSGRDNLKLLARAGRLPLARVGAALERVGMTDRGDDPFKRYSLGMKQRLGLAAALLPEPRLLVLDEPTNGLDPAGIAQMRELLASLHADGITIFVSSHLLSEIEQIADHLVMIRQGRLVFQGPLTDLVDVQVPELRIVPEHPADAELIADIAAAMNWTARADGGLVSVKIPAGLPDDEHLARAAEMNRRAHAVGVTLARLDVHRPTLEQVFFDLTGTASGDVH